MLFAKTCFLAQSLGHLAQSLGQLAKSLSQMAKGFSQKTDRHDCKYILLRFCLLDEGNRELHGRNFFDYFSKGFADAISFPYICVIIR